jgi:hypothetical protein
VNCPNCHSGQIEIVESRRCTNGTRRRRHECLTCQHRWTSWDGIRPKRGGAANAYRHRAGSYRKVTPDAVRAILLAPRTETHQQLAVRLDLSPEMIRQVRIGKAHATVHPELARWGQPVPEAQGKSCYCCIHWGAAACSFGFPDPIQEGPTFARECQVYALVSQSISRACPSSVQ